MKYRWYFPAWEDPEDARDLGDWIKDSPYLREMLERAVDVWDMKQGRTTAWPQKVKLLDEQDQVKCFEVNREQTWLFRAAAVPRTSDLRG